MMKIIMFFVILCVCCSCDKAFLNEKPNKSLLVPTKLDDFEAILDYSSEMNTSTYLNFVSADDYITTNSGYQSVSYLLQNAYLWEPDIYQNSSTGDPAGDWSSCYKQIFNANVVLDGLKDIAEESNKDRINNLKGAALFFRARANFNLSLEFCKQYQSSTAANDLGIPLRLSADVNLRPARSTLEKTYEQIINDLVQSASLLPSSSTFKSRPNQLAAFALLSRVYLSMGRYDKSLFYTDEALKLHSVLVDFNTISPSAARPFPPALPSGNEEVIFYAAMPGFSFLTSSQQTIINPDLYHLYATDDLRKVIYFLDRGNGIINFKGNYTGNVLLFAGLSINELYLTKSECLQRLGNDRVAINTLNSLLIKRWKFGKFVPLEVHNIPLENLKMILLERRKELVFRDLRWMDLKRLNKEAALEQSLKRSINGVDYFLRPNSNLYVLPIPDNELIVGKVEQNPRG